MIQRIIDRKTWHEVITDEMDWELVEQGAWKLVDDCVDPYDPEPCEAYKTNYNEYCHAIIRSEHFPDELSFRQVVTILNSYLQLRWEEYKKTLEVYKKNG